MNIYFRRIRCFNFTPNVNLVLVKFVENKCFIETRRIKRQGGDCHPMYLTMKT